MAASKPPVNVPLVEANGQMPVPWMAFFDGIAAQLLTLGQLAGSTSYANDAAAAAGGVQVGGLYRSGSIVQIRVV